MIMAQEMSRSFVMQTPSRWEDREEKDTSLKMMRLANPPRKSNTKALKNEILKEEVRKARRNDTIRNEYLLRRIEDRV